ncbi:MAG: hypothetical protein UY10_C0003G0067, partial [Microgenomates group bacterium GW2011_GWA2_47_8]
MTNGFQELFGVIALNDELSLPTLSPNTTGVASGVSSGVSIGFLVGCFVRVSIGVGILEAVGGGVFVGMEVDVGV